MELVFGDINYLVLAEEGDGGVAPHETNFPRKPDGVLSPLIGNGSWGRGWMDGWMGKAVNVERTSLS